MTSFAWGLSPSSSRAVTDVGGCDVSDSVWQSRLSLENIREVGVAGLLASCSVEAGKKKVPQLLIGELMNNVARRLLGNNSHVSVPRFKVNTTYVSKERPPKLWLVTLTACFPCSGTPIVRCVKMTALLDAEHVHKSQVLYAVDAGVVPAEQALMDGVLPFNALGVELIVQH